VADPAAGTQLARCRSKACSTVAAQPYIGTYQAEDGTMTGTAHVDNS